jgi:hypothetical protein
MDMNKAARKKLLIERAAELQLEKDADKEDLSALRGAMRDREKGHESLLLEFSDDQGEQ